MLASRLAFAMQRFRFLRNRRKSRKIKANYEREMTLKALKVLNERIDERVSIGKTWLRGRVYAPSQVSDAINRALNVLDQVGYEVENPQVPSNASYHFGFPADKQDDSKSWYFILRW